MGSPDLIPVMNRFPAAPASDESDWQALVIDCLGIADWVRLEWTDELDMVGPYARRTLRRLGPVFPSNAHFLEPILERASGGSLLTGLGGDEVMGPHARQLAAAIRFERRVPHRRELRRAARELAPLPVRARIDASRSQLRRFRWIRSQARDRLARDYARAPASAPLAWDRSLDWLWRSRYTQCLRSSMQALGSAHDVDVGLPFLDPVTLRSFANSQRAPSRPPESGDARRGGRRPPPERLLRRRTKASFDHPYWNRYTRDFAESWTGRGLDRELVDPAELRREWRSPQPIAASSTLLQLAWVAELEASGTLATRIRRSTGSRSRRASKLRGRTSRQAGSAASSSRSSGSGGRIRNARLPVIAEKVALGLSDCSSVVSPHCSWIQPRSGALAGAEPIVSRHRALAPTMPSASAGPNRSAASRRRSMQRGPLSARP